MEQSRQAMRLARFIREEQERILEEFEEFARTHTGPGDTMDILALRDHAVGILSAIALDMEQPQSEAAQERKSKGDAPEDGQPDTAAEKHGTDRADSGFSLQEMFSEYRALRASVLRLWTDDHGDMDGTDVQDLIRFNEAIDQALAESITRFSIGLERSRELFLAILGHDLRTPLSAIVTASSFLATSGGLTGRNLNLAERIHSSGWRMNGLVGDLLDFTRSRLGKGIPVTLMETDLVEIGREAVEEVQVMYPMGEVRFEASGNVRGVWDAGRVSQALTNLIANAVQYGAEATPVVVTARGEADHVVVSIHNLGAVITAKNQQHIFDPFIRIVSAETGRPLLSSMGLGLYIARQIALAHGGSIQVHSSVERGTTFELHLPRRVPAQGG
ncbi:MAG: sensor histidine kinase [Gemmatimonadota bacterium]